MVGDSVRAINRNEANVGFIGMTQLCAAHRLSKCVRSLLARLDVAPRRSAIDGFESIASAIARRDANCR